MDVRMCPCCCRRDYDADTSSFCDECLYRLGHITRDALRKRRRRVIRLAKKADPERRERTRRQMAPVRCVETGQVWRSTIEAAEELGLKPQTLRYAISDGHRIKATGHHYERMAKCQQ